MRWGIITTAGWFRASMTAAVLPRWVTCPGVAEAVKSCLQRAWQCAGGAKCLLKVVTQRAGNGWNDDTASFACDIGVLGDIVFVRATRTYKQKSFHFPYIAERLWRTHVSASNTVVLIWPCDRETEPTVWCGNSSSHGLTSRRHFFFF